MKPDEIKLRREGLEKSLKEYRQEYDNQMMLLRRSCSHIRLRRNDPLDARCPDCKKWLDGSNSRRQRESAE